MTHFSPRCLAVVLTILSALATPTSAQTTLRVPKDFATIQQAVDAAEDGDTIRISKGTYPEYVQIIGLSDLTVIGLGRPVIDGGTVFLGGEVTSGGLLLLNCSNVLIKGLVARNPVNINGFTVSGCTDVTLQLCRVDRPQTDDGLQITSSEGVVVDRFRMQGFKDTFDIEAVAAAGGISILSSKYVTVTRARIQDTFNDGIHVDSSTDVVLERCILKRIDNDGIHASSGELETSVLVDRCKLSDLNDDGIQTTGSMTDITVTKTSIKRADNNGVDASGRAATLDRVTVREAEDNAFRFHPEFSPPAFSADDVVPHGPIRMTNCRASLVGDNGTDLSADGAVIENLRLAKLEGSGVQVGDSEGVEITKVRISKVENWGLEFTNVTNSTFTDFRMSKPRDGVELSSSCAGNVIQGFKIRAPEGFGFEIRGPNNLFQDNTVTKAEEIGFFVNSTGNNFVGNKAVKSGELDVEDIAGKGLNTYTENVFGTTQGL
ncbi:MAG: hypothetical protein DHS20C15_32290 [Planctomycetota bacterium]|nr:MAG: hypothetical protein DHS20C15_32290 [Planctomycetota bacterium]